MTIRITSYMNISGMSHVVLVTNIIITLNAIKYFTKTFITDIWQDRKSAF